MREREGEGEIGRLGRGWGIELIARGELIGLVWGRRRVGFFLCHGCRVFSKGRSEILITKIY